MEIREILAKLKTENGLTTEMLSERSGVPKGTLNKLLNGETRNPTGATLKKIADALNCPVELLYPHGGKYAACLMEDRAGSSYGGSSPFGSLTGQYSNGSGSYSAGNSVDASTIYDLLNAFSGYITGYGAIFAFP